MGRQDSNLRVGDSESPAVPLGYFPNTLVGRVGFEPTAFRLKGESTSTGGTGPKHGSGAENRTLLVLFVGEASATSEHPRRKLWSTALVSIQDPGPNPGRPLIRRLEAPASRGGQSWLREQDSNLRIF
jgi:hypothetical protein